MSDQLDDPYGRLRPLMDACGATCAPARFYWAVNEAFHSAESAGYDAAHVDMFEASAPLWRRLLAHLPASPPRLEVLDVGAGTGLVGGVLAACAPDRVARLSLLDPNQAMLDRSLAKAAAWPFPVEAFRGTVEAVTGRRFDLVTVSSVLHHVVELEPFCAALAAALRPRGALLQLQDPRRGAGDDPLLQARRREAARSAERRVPWAVRARQLVSRALRAAGRQSRNPLAEATNAALLRDRVIARSLDMEAIWAVTDFHVPGQPGGLGRGLAVEELASWWPALELRDAFTYQFHAAEPSTLAPEEQEEEARLWAAGDGHGALFGSAWVRQP